MTVSATPPIVSYSYSGPGRYDYNFLTYKETDIYVYHVDEEGISTVLIQNVDYDVTLGDPGGYITTSNPTEAMGVLTIQRILPVTQEVDWVNNDPLDAEILERSFDRVVMILQQYQVEITESSYVTQWKGDWVSGTTYIPQDIIVDPPTGNWYVGIIEHVSGVFADDLADGYWALALDFEEITALRDECAASADAAALSETNAATSANSAASSASAASNYASQASTHEANSAVNAQNASNCNQAAFEEAERAQGYAESIDPDTLVHKDSDTGAANMPTGDTGQRPPAATGLLRFNTDEASFEGHDGIEWGSIGGGGGLQWQIVSIDTAVKSDQGYMVDSTAAPINLTLPISPEEGDQFGVLDVSGTFGTNMITLIRNGQVIMGIEEDMVLASSYKAITLVFSNSTNGWRISSTTPCNIGDLPVNVGKNLLINGGFNVAQRAAYQTTSGYGSVDRWWMADGGVFSFQKYASVISPFDTAIYTITDDGGAGGYSIINQNIEDVRTASDGKVTLSFTAYRSEGDAEVGINIRQVFGDGGSADVDVTSKVSITSTRNRYSVTLDLASVGDKTVGTNSYIRVMLWLNAGTNHSVNAGGIGNQTGNFIFREVQLEVGSTSTDFEYRSYGEELALCQRYYEEGNYSLGHPVTSVSTDLNRYLNVEYAVEKRDTPTVTVSGGTLVSPTVTGSYTSGCLIRGTVPTASNSGSINTWTADAEIQ